jgi:hypothetical protein
MAIIPVEEVHRRIVVIRGRKVILDADLASLYGVTTTRLNEQVKRNVERFPEDFAFRLTREEFDRLKSHFATSSSTWGGRRKLPNAFTEHGAIMAASAGARPGYRDHRRGDPAADAARRRAATGAFRIPAGEEELSGTPRWTLDQRAGRGAIFD